MAKEDLTLGSGLIRKGEGRGVSPALAMPDVTPQVPFVAPEPDPAAQPNGPTGPEARVYQAMPSVQAPLVEEEPPLRAIPPDDVPKRFTSFRLPVDLDEELRSMMFETRRSKQDLLIDFVTRGVKAWRQGRAKRG
jgi:hypothetical protein